MSTEIKEPTNFLLLLRLTSLQSTYIRHQSVAVKSRKCPPFNDRDSHRHIGYDQSVPNHHFLVFSSRLVEVACRTCLSS